MEKIIHKMRSGFLVLAVLCAAVFAGCVKEGDPVKISVSQQAITLDMHENFAYVNVDSNAEWKASTNQPWCRVSVTKGMFSQKVQVIVDANETGDDRTAVVTFETTKSKVMVTSIVVAQTGDEEENQL